MEHPPLNEQGELTNIHDWLKPAQQAWHQSVQWDTVPWHGIDKARQGAVATFLGITIQPNDDHTLTIQSIAVGDCELFVIDPDDQVTFNFPLVEASKFNNRPDLICSHPKNNVNLDQQVKRATISILPHDRVILTTDALAEWMLSTGHIASHMPADPTNGQRPVRQHGSSPNEIAATSKTTTPPS